MRLWLIGLSLTLVFFATARWGRAQESLLWAPGITIGLDAGWFFPEGDSFEAADDGFGLEGYVGYRVLERLEINLSVHRSSHRVTSFLPNITVLGVFLGPRLYFRSETTPVVGFIGLRGGWLRGELSATARRYESEGLALGFSAGLLHSLTRVVQLEVLGGADVVWFDSVFGEGRESGRALGLQAGLRFLFEWPGSR